ncbi:MAG: DNA polymerase Y family protein [Pseudomonadota bacterium]
MKHASSNPSRRYLAVWFPFLCADRLSRQQRRSPRQDETPLCFIEKHNSALRVTAINRAAVALGLMPDLTLADARARVPHLKAVEMDRTADADWLGWIANGCDRYTPMVDMVAPDMIRLDITGCAHLFGGEAALRDDLIARLSRIASATRSCIAGTPQAARALARFGVGHTIVPTGADVDAVAPLRVAALEAGQETSQALIRAGLKTIGDLAARPRTPLAARFGSGLTTQLARLLGEENIGITPRRITPSCTAERRFAEPVADVETALGTLQGLAVQIAGSLERRGEGGRAFEASFFRTDGAVARLWVDTAKPVRAPETVLRLFRERIDTLHDPLDPGFGYDLIRLAVMASGPFETVQHSLDGREVADDDVAALIDRLTTRLGRDAVIRFVPIESHIPERSVRAVPAGQSPQETSTWDTAFPDEAPSRPLLMFDRPQPIEAVAEIPDGPPLKFRWRRVLHDVARAEGPERIAPEWWRKDESCPTRDYFRVEDAQGRRFWVFRDGLYHEEDRAPRWFLHGLFA